MALIKKILQKTRMLEKGARATPFPAQGDHLTPAPNDLV
jgi:hypothetical protein